MNGTLKNASGQQGGEGITSTSFYQHENSIQGHLDVSDLLSEKEEGRQNFSESPEQLIAPLKVESVGWGGWAIIWFIFSLFTFALYDVFQTLFDAYESMPFWASIMAISTVVTVLILAYLLVVEVRGFWVLKTLEAPITRDKLLQFTGSEAVINALQERAKLQKGSRLASELNERFFQTLQPDYSVEEVVDIYLLNVERPLYQHAESLIQKEVRSVGIATAMTPFSSVQILYLIRWNFTVVRKLCELYGLKLGVVARVKLMKILWFNIVLEVAVDQVTNQVLQGISNHIIGKVVDQTAEATTSALLVYRMGNGLLKHLSLVTSKS